MEVGGASVGSLPKAAACREQCLWDVLKVEYLGIGKELGRVKPLLKSLRTSVRAGSICRAKGSERWIAFGIV